MVPLNYKGLDLSLEKQITVVRKSKERSEMFKEIENANKSIKEDPSLVKSLLQSIVPSNGGNSNLEAEEEEEEESEEGEISSELKKTK